MRSACLMVDSRCAMTIAVRWFKQLVQALLDQRLGEGIDARGGLVEDDHRGVLQQHPRQRDELALAQ